jgi:hypothetical protein
MIKYPRQYSSKRNFINSYYNNKKKVTDALISDIFIDNNIKEKTITNNIVKPIKVLSNSDLFY